MVTTSLSHTFSLSLALSLSLSLSLAPKKKIEWCRNYDVVSKVILKFLNVQIRCNRVCLSEYHKTFHPPHHKQPSNRWLGKH